MGGGIAKYLLYSLQCTEVRFAIFLSGGFTTMVVTTIPYMRLYIFYPLSQWFKMPDHLRKLILTSDCWKQVNCAYFLSEKANFFLKKIVQGHQRPKRPMKANKGQQSPRLQIYLLLSLFNVKSSINVNMILKKCV